jgi:hypothetical protein
MRAFINTCVNTGLPAQSHTPRCQFGVWGALRSRLGSGRKGQGLLGLEPQQAGGGCSKALRGVLGLEPQLVGGEW